MAAVDRYQFIITARDRTRAVFRRVRRALSGIRTQLAALAAAVGLTQLARQAGEFARNVESASKWTGATTTEIQALAAIAAREGIDFDDVADALSSINQAAGEAALGSGEMYNAIRRLGVTDRLLEAGPLAAFTRIVETLSNAGDDFRKYQADVSRIFGEDVARRFGPILRGGTERFYAGLSAAVNEGRVATQQEIAQSAELQRQAADLAVSTQEKLIGGLSTLNESVNALNSTIQGMRAQAANEVLPSLGGTYEEEASP